MLAFIHLSDIHFTKHSGDRYDIDNDLRNELLADISSNLLTHIPKVDGILLCGDIAFSGKTDEYETAYGFLNQICDALSLPQSMVYCVPGNHDVNHGVPKESIVTNLLQDTLEAQLSINAFDSYLGSICRDTQSAKALFAPIETYNSDFAGKYGCALSDNLNTYHLIPLTESYNLCIAGINSTLISNSDDHRSPDKERLMRIGQLQIPQSKRGTVYLTLCHHPPECWYDPETKLQQKMNNRVRIQLYGHKHLQTIKIVDNSLIIGSGATHPSRWEPEWVPRYNWITIDIHSNEGQDYLDVKIYPRVLDESESCFETDPLLKTGDYFGYTLNLNDRKDSSEAPTTVVLETNEMPRFPLDMWKKEFIYSFMNLSYFHRKQIITDFRLDSPDDEGRKHVELLEQYIKRTQTNNCFDGLLAAIQVKREGIDKK